MFVKADGDRDLEVTRHWYHVPRMGEMVWLREIAGKVFVVSWNEDHVEVILK